MDEEYDIRISQTAWRQGLEVYTRAKALLETERENQMAAINKLMQNWSGLSAQEYAQAMKAVLERGTYQGIYEKVTKLQKMFQDNDGRIAELRKRCEMFPEQLQYDEYQEVPALPADSPVTPGSDILCGNYRQLERMSFLCGEVDEVATKWARDMDSIMESCSDLIPETDQYRERLAEVYARLHRYRNLQTAVDRYRRDLQALEEDINVVLRDILAEKEKQIEEEIFENRYDRDVAKETGFVQHLKELGYIDAEIKKLQKSVKSEEDEIFVSSLFSGDSTLYHDAFRIDPGQISPEVLQWLTDHLLKCEQMEWDNEIRSAGVAELENIINALLYSDNTDKHGLDRYYRDDYIIYLTNEMETRSRDKTNEMVEKMLDGRPLKEVEKLKEDSKAAFNQYALWKSILQVSNLEIEGTEQLANAYRDGAIHLKITDLDGGLRKTDDGAGTYSYRVLVLNSNTWDTYDKREDEMGYFEVRLSYPLPYEVNADEKKEKMDQIAEKIEEYPEKMALDAIKEVPGVEMTLRMIRGMDTSDAEKIIEILPKEAKGVLDKVDYDTLYQYTSRDWGPEASVTRDLETANVGLGVVSVLWEDFFERIRLEKEGQLTEQQYYINYFGKYIRMESSYSGNPSKLDVDYIGHQMYSADVVYNLYRLSIEGIDAYLTDPYVNADEKTIRKIKEKIEGNLKIINNSTDQPLDGEEIQKYTRDDLINDIQKIEKARKDCNNQLKTFEQWLNP